MQKITSVNILSFAKVFGAFGMIIGFIAGVFYGLMIIAASGAGAVAHENHGGAFAAFGLGAGLLMIFLMPIVVGILQFFAGLIYGLVINLALWLAGGLELRIESTSYSR